MKVVKKVSYPDKWSEIAYRVKEDADWKCVRCGHKNEKESGYMLTVHHLDSDINNNKWWNLAALCQRCHLKLQAKSRTVKKWIKGNKEWVVICIIEKQMELFIKEEYENGWYKPYLEGFLENKEGCEKKNK